MRVLARTFKRLRNRSSPLVGEDRPKRSEGQMRGVGADPSNSSAVTPHLRLLTQTLSSPTRGEDQCATGLPPL
jgi:hypothetical protein